MKTYCLIDFGIDMTMFFNYNFNEKTHFLRQIRSGGHYNCHFCCNYSFRKHLLKRDVHQNWKRNSHLHTDWVRKKYHQLHGFLFWLVADQHTKRKIVIWFDIVFSFRSFFFNFPYHSFGYQVTYICREPFYLLCFFSVCTKPVFFKMLYPQWQWCLLA